MLITMDNLALIKHLKEYGRLRINEPMERHTSIRIGGPAQIFIQITNMENLLCLLNILKKEDIPITVVGGGTNLLISDKGITGVVVKLTGNFRQIQQEDDGLISVGAGVSMSLLVKFCAEVGLSGAEQLAGLPGSVGGALYGNSGAFGRSIGELVSHVFTIKNTTPTLLRREDIKFFYRGSSLKDTIITGCKLKLVPSNVEKVRKGCEYFLALRKKSQPTGVPTAGCIFKNPKEGMPAGWLIERSGCKGMSVGKVHISQKHANFIENTNGGSCRDVLALIAQVKERVYKKFKVVLEEEVQILGGN